MLLEKYFQYLDKDKDLVANKTLYLEVSPKHRPKYSKKETGYCK